MKKIIFIDKNKRLVNKVKKALGECKIQVKCGDIFAQGGVIVSASNPDFTMGGGLDYLIAQKYPKECIEARKTPNKNKRIGNVIFTITVDDKLKSNYKLVKKALSFAKKSLKKNETLLVSGLGTGIGRLSYKDFASIFVEVFGNTSKNVVTRYKFLIEGLKSDSGYITWKIGKWKHEDSISLCNRGFHCSNKIIDALSYVQGEVLAVVECGGLTEKDSDGSKEVFQDMRIVKAYKWQKEDSVALAIYASELVIGIFEKEYPKDKRPREAIEAARKWLKNPTYKNAYAANASAYAAAYAANASAYAADAAANASANASYAVSAAANASYAVSAAYAANAADDEVYTKIEKWLVEHIKELDEIK